MKKEKSRPLRWRLMAPLAVTFALLWLGVVAMLFSGSQREVESSVARAQQWVQDSLDNSWQSYVENQANGMENAGSSLRQSLSNLSMGQLSYMDGGVALLARNEETGEVFRSQITWGYGYEEAEEMDQRWYLTFDQGLDREGHLAFGRWLLEHRRSWSYALRPAGEEMEGAPPYDGTWARVTGVEEPERTLAVQKIELVHPDGTEEVMVETDTQGANSVTLELKYLQIQSALFPSISGDGKNGYTDMERRLDNCLETQAILDREMAGEERSVLRSGGSLVGMFGPDNLPLLVVAVQYQTAPYVLRTNWGNYLALLLITAVAAFILSSLQSKKVTQPAEELCRQTETGRCREDGPVRELNALAQAFNAAQEQLEGQLSRERAFTRGAAHELKTPLAVLRTHAEALREDIAPEKREQYLDIILEESDRMATLVGSLLELSRLESGIALNKEPLDLGALTRKVFAPLELALQQKKISLRLDLPELWIEGDRERLKRAIENLASNALRHCTSGGCIQVALNVSEDGVRLLVRNDGPAVSEQDLPHLWEPFYRGDQARSRDTGGTGLGLAIVRAAIQAHGGSCGVENGPHDVSFWFCLPSSVLLK